MKLLKYLLPVVALSLFMLACGKEEENNIIPAYKVNFRVNVSSLDRDLAVPTNYKTFTSPRLAEEYVGYSGLLVVCSATLLQGSSNLYELYAYDLCCTHEKDQNIRVQPQSDGTAKCPKCGSVYNILNGVGNVQSGPSKNGLQRYSARYTGGNDGVFYITR